MNAATTEANFFRRFLHRSVPLYKAHLSIYDRVPTWSRSCHVYKSTLLWRIRRRMVVLFGGKDRVESVISLIRVSTLTEQRLSAWYQYLVTIWRRDTYRIVEGKSIHARISTKESWSSRLDHVEDEHSQACFLTRLSPQASTVCFSNCQRERPFGSGIERSTTVQNRLKHAGKGVFYTTLQRFSHRRNCVLAEIHHNLVNICLDTV